MAIFKTLIKIITRNYTTTRTLKNRTNFLTCSTTTVPTTLTSPKPPFFNAPLFLSSPPWKLSQSAISVHLQSDAVLFPKRKAFDLIRLRIVQEVVSRDPTLLSNSVKSEVNGDDDESFRDSFVNLPNFVSMSRLVSGPVLGWMIIEGWYLPAFVGLAISGATDWLDGYIARKMNINSVVGSYLDPLADKVLIGCVALAMVHNDLLHPGLVAIVVLRDVGLVGGAVYKRASDLDWKWKTWRDFFNLNGTSPQKVEPLFISKVNTVFQLALVAGALLQPDFGTDQTQSYITYLSWLVASTTVASTTAYGAQQLRLKSASSIRNH